MRVDTYKYIYVDVILSLDGMQHNLFYLKVCKSAKIIVPLDLLYGRMGVLSKLIEEGNLKLVSYQ